MLFSSSLICLNDHNFLQFSIDQIYVSFISIFVFVNLYILITMNFYSKLIIFLYYNSIYYYYYD